MQLLSGFRSRRGKTSAECGLIGDRRELRRALIYKSIYISKDPERQKQIAERVQELELEIGKLKVKGIKMKNTETKKVTTRKVATGLESLLGQNILIFGLNYIYTGKLTGVDAHSILLSDPSIVYETGPFTQRGYGDVQKLHVDEWHISRYAIESFGLGK